MTTTPEQINQALQHVLQSQNDKARWRRASSIIGQMTITGVTDEE
jgi:hypothetical protein